MINYNMFKLILFAFKIRKKKQRMNEKKLTII